MAAAHLCSKTSPRSRACSGRTERTFTWVLNDYVNEVLMAVMNRLSPLIVRRVGPFAPALALPPFTTEQERSTGVEWSEDLRLFATGWLGGLVFFGTLLA